VNAALFRHAWRLQRVKLAVVCVGLFAWGCFPPLIYAKFGSQFEAMLESGIFPQQFARLGGGDIFSLTGSVALGLIHPIALILTSVFAVGFPVSAIAGERQQGTLEIVLARPIGRRSLYFTLLASAFLFVGMALAALLAGCSAGAAFAGVFSQLPLRHMPLLWLNAVLLFGAVAAVGLAASASFDRFAPALGWTLGIEVGMYVLEVLGSLWPDAAFLQKYSLFHYLRAKATLAGSPTPSDLLVLISAIALAIAWSLVVFPRRDLAAPI
jgi:beta-exotoxin I transport system permease protein